MISVIAIMGETYDLATGEETPKGIVLSNGQRSITVEVSDEVIKEVILLDVESRRKAIPEAPKNGKSKKVRQVQQVPPDIAPEYLASVAEVLDENPLGEAAEPPLDDDPGVDYADADTGVASV